VSFDIAHARKRLVVMAGLNAVCVVVAIGALVAFFKADIGWAIWLFAAALVGGFAAQIWFIAGLRAAKREA
jgi:hypothetical protein